MRSRECAGMLWLEQDLLVFPWPGISYRFFFSAMIVDRSRVSVEVFFLVFTFAQFTNPSVSVSVELFDERGIAAGASGASGGLLHPFSPTGKLLWKGAEGFRASLDLVAVAESMVPEDDEPISWKRGILRPALCEKHTRNFRKNVDCSNGSAGAPRILTAREAKELLPGLFMQDDLLALHIRAGINIDPKRYLEALWKACLSFANSARMSGCPGTKASLHKRRIASICDLSDYDAVVLCLGAQAPLLPELQGKLPLTPCRGVVAQMELPEKRSEQFNGTAPSVLSRSWLAFQGKRRLLLGATKEAFISPSPRAQDLSALEELYQKARQLYPGISQWEVTGLREGIRALPPRYGDLGAIPLVGSLDGDVRTLESPARNGKCRPPRLWIFGGLGSRGLVYHAWLGSKVAQAVVLENQEVLPQEARQWKNLT
ncbi:uncharacterized protein LOC9646940 isoform X1 [Selaginella moellendorffii]|nr:uncharacterized protein LOC9646940 isoform X1 [Selaginella moellendorffii]|eukprot:XP_002961780.2 uncharacterized protein LOC9646940 isoform X1 [Selaginella moellendorffii]